MEQCNLRWYGLVHHKMRRYFGWFVEMYREEFSSIVAYVAVEAQPFTEIREASRVITRHLRRQIVAYGWKKDPLTNKWCNPERTRFIDGFAYRSKHDYWQAKGLQQCGVTGCQLPGIMRDEVYEHICRSHYDYIYERKRKGVENPRLGVSKHKYKPRRAAPKVTVTCTTCGAKVRQLLREAKRHDRHFCSPECKLRDFQANVLDVSKVAKIKTLLAAGQSPKEIAAQMNCSDLAVRRIRSGATWAYVVAA